MVSTAPVQLSALELRFWSKVDKSGDCWLWTAAKSHDGYGLFRYGGKNAYAHRVSYEWANGPVVPGLDLDHLCRVRSCVNPAHLEPVTRRINLLRGDTRIAHNIATTHCPQGHAYDALNTYVRPRGGTRDCRTCHRERELRRYRARMA